jgi:hypothetical protein
MSSLQAQIEERGERIFDLVDRHPESVFSKAGFYQRMMALSMRDEHFKVQMRSGLTAILRPTAYALTAGVIGPMFRQY